MPTGVALITTSKWRVAHLIVQNGFARDQPGQRAHAIRIAARDAQLRAGIRQCAGRAAGRAAIADNQQRRLSADRIIFDSGPDTASASVFVPRHLPALRQTVFTAPMRRASGSM